MVPLSRISSMETLMSLELFSLFSTERQSCCAAWTMLCFPSSGDNIFTVGLQDTTDTQENDTLLCIILYLKKMKKHFFLLFK